MNRFKKFFNSLFFEFNILFAVFYLLYVFANIKLNMINIVSAAAFILICCDFIYAASYKTKNTPIQIVLTAILFIINFASNYIAGLSAYTLDKNYIGIISTILIFVINAVFIYVNEKKQCKRLEINKKAAIVLYTAGILFLLSILIVGMISLFAKTPVNTNTVNLALLFIVLCSAVLGLLISLSGSFTSKNALFFAVVMFVLAVVPFSVLQLSVVYDINQANIVFADMNVEPDKNMRKLPYSVADEFIGVETNGFEIKRDVVYYTSDEGVDKGLSLRYDMYLPENSSKDISVLVNIHGSGGDKDTGNYAHRNKYFAGRGYAVFDLQIGDWNESNTGFTEDMYSSENMLFHIDKFFEYLSNHNDENLNLSSVFITGVSMGGGLAGKYAYSYDNHLNDYGIVLKGIIPVYPGYSQDSEGIDNYLNYVDGDSVPTMIVMGVSDCIVRTETVTETLNAFEGAGNHNCYALEISYAGHGSDSLMTGRTNQMIMYYAERFMENFK